MQNRLFGVLNSTASAFCYSVYINGSGGVTFGCGDTWSTFVGINADLNRHTIICDSNLGKFQILTDGVTVSDVNITSSRTLTSLYPFALGTVSANAAGSTGEFVSYDKPMKIYGCKIYEAGELVRDFHPCTIGGVAGLRDSVTDTFVIPSSGDALANGGDIEAEEDAGYVQLASNTALNSRFFIDPTAKVEIDYAFYSTNNISQARIIGISGDTVNCQVYVGGGGVSCILGDGAGIAAYSQKSGDLARHTIVVDAANKLFTYKTGFTSVFSATVGATTLTAGYPLGIGGWSASKSGLAFAQYAEIRIYGMRCYYGDELVHDYRPVVLDGAIGLLDRVDGEFITTGTLTAGGAIESTVGPAYIESTYQDCSIDTGTYFGPNSRIVADYAFVSTSVDPQQFVIDANDGVNTVARFYSNSNTQISFGCQSYSESIAFTNTQIPIRLYERHVGDIDAVAKTVSMTSSGYTNYTGSTKTLSANCSATTKLVSSADGSAQYALVRIYGVKIYESGTLVRDYIPYVKDGVAGLYDRVNATFTIDSDKRNSFTAGGDITIDGASDAYIESDGTQLLDTGYHVNANSRLECDYQLVYAGKSGDYQQRLFGNDAFDNNYALYISGNGDPYFAIGDTRVTVGPVSGDVLRHTAVIDYYKSSLKFVTGTTVKSWDISDKPHANTASMTLPIFARYADAAATTGGCFTKMRLYSFKIYEKDELVHEFLPMKKDGVIGLYDTIAAAFVTVNIGSASTLKYGGAGYDGSGAAAGMRVEPESVSLRQNRADGSIKVYAPGAIAYRWTKNGVVIDGAVGDMIDVAWERKKLDELDDVYTVTAVYLVYGAEVESDPYTFTVSNLRAPFIFSLR